MISEILLPQNTQRSAFFGFPDNKENFEIMNHLYLILFGNKRNKSRRIEERY